MAHYQHKGQSKLGSYPVINVVFSTTLALLVVGLFGLLMLHAARLTGIIKENVKIQVYLHKNILESEGIRVGQLLSKKDFVLKKMAMPSSNSFLRKTLRRSLSKQLEKVFCRY